MPGPRLYFESTRYFLQSAIRTVIPLLQKIPCESKALRDHPVGCELAFKQLLAADTNRGSALANDNRPGERPHDP